MAEENNEAEEEIQEEENEEELENIIRDETPEILDFRKTALEEILPTLQPRETQNLEQGIENIRITEEEDKPAVSYDIQQATNKTGYEGSTEYQLSTSSGNYDPSSVQTPDGSPEKMRFRNQQDQFQQTGMGMSGQQPNQNQGFQQRQYEADFERKTKEERKKMF